MPCLFAILAATFPRLALLLVWLFTPIVNNAFGGWIVPLLGFIFLPFTTLMYALVFGVPQLGPTSLWSWLMILLGVFIDIRGYFDAYGERTRLPFSTPGMIRPGPGS
jgi:hypothetical protein